MVAVTRTRRIFRRGRAGCSQLRSLLLSSVSAFCLPSQTRLLDALILHQPAGTETRTATKPLPVLVHIPRR
jgi:hypothetical protein